MNTIVKKSMMALLFLLIGYTTSIGQDNEPKSKVYQIGLNVGPLWTNIIHHESLTQNVFFFNSIFNTTEVLSFKSRKKNTALRLGFGGKHVKQKIEDNTNVSRSVLARIGMEKQIEFTKKWQCFYGLDLKLNLGVIKNNFNDDPYKWNRIGLSSFLGMQYRLTPRLILQTEASLQISQTTTRNSNQFFIDPITVFPIEPGGASEKTIFRNLNIVLPNLLYLAFEF